MGDVRRKNHDASSDRTRGLRFRLRPWTVSPTLRLSNKEGGYNASNSALDAQRRQGRRMRRAVSTSGMSSVHLGKRCMRSVSSPQPNHQGYFSTYGSGRGGVGFPGFSRPPRGIVNNHGAATMWHSSLRPNDICRQRAGPRRAE